MDNTEEYQKDFIKQVIGLGFKLVAGTLNLYKENGKFVNIYVVPQEFIKSNYNMHLALTGEFIETISSVTQMPKEYFDRMAGLFNIKLI